MPDDRRLLLQPPDHLEVMVENLSEGFARENFGISVGLFDRLRVVRPSRRQRRVAGRPEDRSPTVPTARQQPEPVYEENRRRPGLVCAQTGVPIAARSAHVSPASVSAIPSIGRTRPRCLSIARHPTPTPRPRQAAKHVRGSKTAIPSGRPMSSPCPVSG